MVCKLIALFVVWLTMTASAVSMLIRGRSSGFISHKQSWRRYASHLAIPEKDHEIIRITKNWVQCFVYGLNLCPFSGGVIKSMKITVNRKDIRKSNTESIDLCNDILREAQYLIDGKAPTTLIVLPEFNENFDNFLELCNVIESLLEENKLDHRIQVASFHPLYVFADSDEDDVENYTNRAPHSIIHLLLVDEVSKAINAYGDTKSIYQNNMKLMRKLGIDKIKKMLKDL